MRLELIIHALTLADRPANRARWIQRGFRKIHARGNTALLTYWERRLRWDAAARRLAREVWISYERQAVVIHAGPGTRLEALLAFFGIKPVAGCKCRKHANAMNDGGPDWCAQNISMIVGWMRMEARARRLFFVPWAAGAAVGLSITLSRFALWRLRYA